MKGIKEVNVGKRAPVGPLRSQGYEVPWGRVLKIEIQTLRGTGGETERFFPGLSPSEFPSG